LLPGCTESQLNISPGFSEKILFSQKFWYGALYFILLAGCSGGILESGDIARPLVGNYGLESRTVTLQDSSSTVLNSLMPPEVSGLLRLSVNGRYGQVDTTFVSDSTAVYIQNGRWSVLKDAFYFITDDNQQYENKFTFDGLRLVRISKDNFHSTGPYYTVTDIWLKQ
tara:strand:+ start:691 stop:1194 length:504 start_codon:yes stop_codon:yes gene_type:complete